MITYSVTSYASIKNGSILSDKYKCDNIFKAIKSILELYNCKNIRLNIVPATDGYTDIDITYLINSNSNFYATRDKVCNMLNDVRQYLMLSLSATDIECTWDSLDVKSVNFEINGVCKSFLLNILSNYTGQFEADIIPSWSEKEKAMYKQGWENALVYIAEEMHLNN